MDFHTFHRRDLQSLCKLNKIPANMTNLAMADALQALSKVEGLDSFKESQHSTPARTAGSRSCRGISRTTAKKEGVEISNSEGVEIPNSPTTLSARGRRTRTIVMRNLEPKEDEEGKKASDLVKTPAARSTRGRKPANSAQKSSIGEKKTDGEAPSTRRVTRASAMAMNPSASRIYSRRRIAGKGLDMSNKNEHLAGEEGDVAESSPQIEKASPQVLAEPTAVDNSCLASELVDLTAVEDSVVEKSIDRAAVSISIEDGDTHIDQTTTEKIVEGADVPEENLVLSGSDDLTATVEYSTVAAEEIDGEEGDPSAAQADLTVGAEIAGEEELGGGVTAAEILIAAGKEENDAEVKAADETTSEKLTVAAADFAGEVAESEEPEVTGIEDSTVAAAGIEEPTVAAAEFAGEEIPATGIEVSTVAATGIEESIVAAAEFAGEENLATVAVAGIENSTVAAAEFAGEAAEKNKENLEACLKYDGATSLRKLKAAVKEKLQAMEEKKKRAALASLDDNSILFSPSRVRV